MGGGVPSKTRLLDTQNLWIIIPQNTRMDVYEGMTDCKCEAVWSHPGTLPCPSSARLCTSVLEDGGPRRGWQDWHFVSSSFPHFQCIIAYHSAWGTTAFLKKDFYFLCTLAGYLLMWQRAFHLFVLLCLQLSASPCGIRSLNLQLLYWKVESLPLDLWGSPG